MSASGFGIGMAIGVALSATAGIAWRLYRRKYPALPRKKMNRYAAIEADAKAIREWSAKWGMDKPIPETPEMKGQRLQFAERMKTVPDELGNLSLDLAKRGWYVDADVPIKFLYYLRGLFRDSKEAEVDLMMVSYLHHVLGKIQEDVRKTFPNRAAVLTAAFEAHNNEQYALCVPVFLAQADGICAELIGVGVYGRKKGTPRTAAGVADFSKSMFWMLEPLKVAGAINANEAEKDQYPDILNRHQVLHGKSLDYGTVMNSYRAISLLNYLHGVLPMAIEYREWQEEKKNPPAQPAP